MVLTCIRGSRTIYVSLRPLLFRRYKSSDIKSSTPNMASQNFIEKRYDNIIKSANDVREYRGLLLTNKMKILLISNPTTDTSAAALDVNIGHSSDPDDVQGLAHFCEHMLFLGTEKYHNNEYNTFLSQHGGSCNAVTDMDHTAYYFNVHSDHLEGALDRFVQFFIAPLFTEVLTELELNAIHLEYEANATNDTWRVNQVERSSANPNHPFSKFGCGNRETLETIPKQKNINVREKLLEFHETYYSANAMALCVLGKESLDELEEMTVKLFSQVKNKEIEIPVWLEHPFSEEDYQTKWYIVPIKNTRSLNIAFPLPDLRDHYKSAPAHYLAYLLGHEGKGSLISALKANGWCNAVMSGKRSTARGYNFFHVIVDLTEEGIQHVDAIILLTFQYINMLKEHGPVEWIYNEYRDIADMNFRFKEKESPLKYVLELVCCIQDYPMEEVLVAENLFMSWEPDLIESIMKYLVPEKVRIHIVGQLHENICNETEKWYGTKFKKEKIPKSIIDKWSNAGSNSDLKLPPKNEFIPKRFDIKPAENVTKFPVIIDDTPLMRLWFKQDDEFLVPKAKLYIDFASPLAYIDPLSYNLTSMFVQLLRDASNEYAYAADLACLKFETNNYKYGITIVIHGYDDKQHVLLEEIMNKLVNFKVDPKRFEVFKESYIRSLKNFETDQPVTHTVYYLNVLLSEHVWTKDEFLKATPYLTAERLQEFIPQFLSKVHIECLIHGNVTKSEALETAKLIETKLTSAVPQIIPLLPRHMISYREIRLDDGCHFLFEVENKSHRNSCTEVYYQTGLQSTESNMLLELLAQLIAEPCFTTLRTKEQLGYIVFSGVRRTESVQGLRIVVQSDRHPMYVEQRIDAFLQDMLVSRYNFDKYLEQTATLKYVVKFVILNNFFLYILPPFDYSLQDCSSITDVERVLLEQNSVEQKQEKKKEVLTKDNCIFVYNWDPFIRGPTVFATIVKRKSNGGNMCRKTFFRMEKITNMSDEEFNRHKESLAVKRLEKPKLMSTLTTIFLSEILTQRYNFDRANIEVAHLRTIKQTEIVQFFKKILQRDIQHKLSVHVIPTAQNQDGMKKDEYKNTESNDSKTNTQDYIKITDIMAFRTSQSLHPLLMPFNNITRRGVQWSKL